MRTSPGPLLRAGPAAWLGSPWSLDRRQAIGLGVAVLALVIVKDLLALRAVATTPGLVSDYFAFWSFAEFVHGHAPAEIYQPAALHRFQMQLGLDVNLPFLYPPPILLLLAPLRMLPYAAGFALWVTIGLALHVASLWSGERPGTAFLVLVAPASIVCGALGQIGLLIGALLVGGLRLAPARPVLGGIALGLAAVKPQCVLLVPLALISAGRWRCLASAAATMLTCALLGSLAFGWSIWPVWLHAIPELGRTVAAMPSMVAFMPSVTGNLRLLGAGPELTAPMQALAAVLAAWAVCRAFRAGPNGTAIAVLLAAGFLATPFALIGDLPLITAAVVLIVQERMVAGQAFRTGEIAAMALAVGLPYLMIGYQPFPFSAMIIALLLALAATSRFPAATSIGRSPLAARE